jgi:hypothetical protein
MTVQETMSDIQQPGQPEAQPEEAAHEEFLARRKHLLFGIISLFCSHLLTNYHQYIDVPASSYII